MRKFYTHLILTTIFFLGCLVFSPNSVQAEGELTSCTLTPSGVVYTFTEDVAITTGTLINGLDLIPLTFQTGFPEAKLASTYDINSFEVGVCNEASNGLLLCNGAEYDYFKISDGGLIRTGNQFMLRLTAYVYNDGEFKAVLRAKKLGDSENSDVCPEVFPAFTVKKALNIPPADNCATSLTFNPSPITVTDTQITITFDTGALNDAVKYSIWWDETNVSQYSISQSFSKYESNLLGGGSQFGTTTTKRGSIVTFVAPIESVTNGGEIILSGVDLDPNNGAALYNACKKTITYNPTTGEGDETTGSSGLLKYQICNQIPPGNQKQKCEQCHPEGIWTAVGCIKTNATSIVTEVVQIGLGLAGGIALLMIIAAGFLFSTSQNDPKKVTEARDLITSAIIGLLFIVFSITILQFIGVSILRIPGFGGP